MKKTVRVLGVDPGTRNVGFGVIDKVGSRLHPVTYGAIAAKAKDLPERLKQIHDGLAEIIAEHHPDVVAVEEAFYAKSVTSTLRLGEGRGVVLLCAAEAGLPVSEYAPRLVKRAVVGTGAAHKSQVQQMVKSILGLDKAPQPADAADALAIAICHCNRMLS
ncbi:MAG: crossover junction endodeoxyribonuclease RuvC [Planctomycetes bacterium]|nr:crossover junction endodeoxyribonuclease RuvC [Planctomycetota bacterium]